MALLSNNTSNKMSGTADDERDDDNDAVSDVRSEAGQKREEVNAHNPKFGTSVVSCCFDYC